MLFLLYHHCHTPVLLQRLLKYSLLPLLPPISLHHPPNGSSYKLPEQSSWNKHHISSLTDHLYLILCENRICSNSLACPAVFLNLDLAFVSGLACLYIDSWAPVKLLAPLLAVHISLHPHALANDDLSPFPARFSCFFPPHPCWEYFYLSFKTRFKVTSINKLQGKKRCRDYLEIKRG